MQTNKDTDSMKGIKGTNSVEQLGNWACSMNEV